MTTASLHALALLLKILKLVMDSEVFGSHIQAAHQEAAAQETKHNTYCTFPKGWISST